MKPSKVIALTSLAGGAALLAAAAREAVRYSSLDDPGAVNIALRLGLAGAALLGVFAVTVVAAVIRNIVREARALGLSRGQAAVAGLAALEFAQFEWARHNAEVSNRLTDSVMGRAREQ
jgi:hypothetical protein